MLNSDLIGARIKEIRKRKKLSQEKLAQMVCMNHRSIVRLENSYSKPSIETLEKIAAALGVSVIDFFETETVKSRSQIVDEINQCIASMSDEELSTFYKAVYHFIH